MATKHTLKRGSTRPVLRYPLPGVDLTGATATFLMSPRPGQPATVNAPAVIANGALEYHWQLGDTDHAVTHYGEFEVVFPGGAVETFPSDDYIRIVVKQDIGDGGAVAPPALIVLSGALVEAGADVASGSASVSISLSGAMAEDGSDTASGSLSIVAPGAITLSAALVEAGADTASGEMTVTTPAPTVTIPVPGGNVLSTTASITPEGEVTITNTPSALTGDLGVIHYMVRADNMLGKTLTARRSTNDPTAADGNDLTQWQMAWSADPDDGWQPFDSYVNSGGFIVATNAAPLAAPTVYIARRPVFSYGRWTAAIARWVANPLTSPTPSGDPNYIVGTLPAHARAPSLPLHGLRFGTGPAKVVLTGMIHVDEHIGAYAYEALVDWLLSSDPDAAYVRSKCTIYAYPNLNPQALYAGASRNEITTADNANRIWTATTEFDGVPLSKTWRDIWAVDLAGGIAGSLDFHDAARGAGYAMTYDAVNGSSELMGSVQAEYFRRNNFVIDRNPGGTTLPVSGGVNRYLRDTFGGTWAVTVEHYISKDHGIPQWQAWGRDFGRGLRDFYDTDGTAKWIDPAWQMWSTANNAYLNEVNGIVTTGRDANSPGLVIPIPEGRSIEIIIDSTARTNVSRLSVRQGLGTGLTGFVELSTSPTTGSTWRRVQTATWAADKTHVGIIGLATNGANPSSFTLSSMVKYRVLSVTTPAAGSITLSAALTEAGADTASGAASVAITASAAMVESGADTASGEMTVAVPITAQRVIILTDYAGDCDDAMALGVACAAHKRGDIDILGVVATSTVETAAPGVYGQLAAYGLQGIPVYAYQGSLGTYNNRFSAAVRDAFGVPGQTRAAYEDDVTGLRRLLASAPDGLVKLIDIGAPVSTARLLDSPADAISPMTGAQLVAAKVAGLWMMAGQFDSATAEYNATRHIPSTQRVYHDWPTPIFAHGYEVGATVFTGPDYSADPLGQVDPVVVAFKAFQTQGTLANGKRQSWDPVTLHHAIYGDTSLYTAGGANGTIMVNSSGVTTWAATPGNRTYIAKASADAQIAAAVEAVYAETLDMIPVPPPSTADAAVNAAILSLNPLMFLTAPDGATIPDASGNGRNATIVGTQGSAITEGPAGMPFFHSDTATYAWVAHDAAFNSAERTQCAWVNTTSSFASTVGIYRGAQERMAFLSPGTKLGAEWNSTNNLLEADNALAPMGQWTFVAMTMGSSGSVLYTSHGADPGKLRIAASNAATAGLNTTLRLALGARATSSTAFDRIGRGGFAKVARWDRALTQAELEQIFNAAA